MSSPPILPPPSHPALCPFSPPLGFPSPPSLLPLYPPSSPLIASPPPLHSLSSRSVAYVSLSCPPHLPRRPLLPPSSPSPPLLTHLSPAHLSIHHALLLVCHAAARYSDDQNQHSSRWKRISCLGRSATLPLSLVATLPHSPLSNLPPSPPLSPAPPRRTPLSAFARLPLIDERLHPHRSPDGRQSSPLLKLEKTEPPKQVASCKSHPYVIGARGGEGGGRGVRGLRYQSAHNHRGSGKCSSRFTVCVWAIMI